MPSSHREPPTGRSHLGPRHVAIIMDGNGRWANARGLPRAAGHKSGVDALKRTVEAAGELGVEWLTVFGFSTENWTRPRGEVSGLMDLIRAYVKSDLDRLEREGVRVHVIGSREGLEPDIVATIERAETRTAHNSRFHLQVAFNYGGRADIVRAANRAAATAAAAGRPLRITEDDFGSGLSTAASPPLDLIVRTSGERRLSNFLLWEAAYAELVFQSVLWPDYGREHLSAAIEEFRGRQRRFGGVLTDDALAVG